MQVIINLNRALNHAGNPVLEMITTNDQVSAIPQTFSLRNSCGLNAMFCELGARIMRLQVPVSEGKFVDVVLGYNSEQEYVKSADPYFGATIGRFANRIDQGNLLINNRKFQLPQNDGSSVLHGGDQGFHNQKWTCTYADDHRIAFSFFSADGEGGFPGNLHVRVEYSVNDENELRIDYHAETDSPTVINLTNHAYFNLNGEGSGSILNHHLQINAKYFIPVSDSLIPTGDILPVNDTPFDFRKPVSLSSRIISDHEQLCVAGGFDHCFVLEGDGLAYAASIVGDLSAIKMDVFTTEPGMQLYSGNFMTGKNRMRHGTDDYRSAFCMETQHFPDSPNQERFPSTILLPGVKYKSSSIYRFSLLKS